MKIKPNPTNLIVPINVSDVSDIVKLIKPQLNTTTQLAGDPKLIITTHRSHDKKLASVVFSLIGFEHLSTAVLSMRDDNIGYLLIGNEWLINVK